MERTHGREFSEGEKALVEKIAWEVGRQMASQIRDDRQNEIRVALGWHENQCPGRALPVRIRGFMLGMACTAGLFGAGGAVAALKLFGIVL